MVKNCCAKETSIEFCLPTGHSELWSGCPAKSIYNCNLNSLCCVCGLMICWHNDDCHLSPGCKLAGLKNCNGVNSSTQCFQWSWGFMTWTNVPLFQFSLFMFDFVLPLKQASGHTESMKLWTNLKQKLFLPDQPLQAASSVSSTWHKVAFGCWWNRSFLQEIVLHLSSTFGAQSLSLLWISIQIQNNMPDSFIARQQKHIHLQWQTRLTRAPQCPPDGKTKQSHFKFHCLCLTLYLL